MAIVRNRIDNVGRWPATLVMIFLSAFLGVFFTGLNFGAQAQVQNDDSGLLIDDMSTPGRATIGGQWQLSTDRVMGGVSRGRARMIEERGQNVIHMTGQVSTANNGGFVQVSLNLRPALDASAFGGIELLVRGNGRPYWVHLRDRNTRRPWKVFNARYESTGRWQTVRIPFDRFGPYHRGSPTRLDTQSLNRIGLVAGYDDFEADLKIGRVSLYR